MNDKPTTDVAIPWTIKGVPQEERIRIVAAAKRSGMTVGEWMQSAARLKLDYENSAIGSSCATSESQSVPSPANDETSSPSRTVPSPSGLDREEWQEMRDRVGLLEGQCASLSRRLDRLSKLLVDKA